jgi:CBS domain-containing protein
VDNLEIVSAIKEDFLVLEPEMTVAGMIGKLKQYEKRTGLVFHNKKYLGLVEKKKLIRAHTDSDKTTIGKFVQNTPLLLENADVLESAYLMVGSDTNFLPVERNKEIIGVLRSVDLVALAVKMPELNKLKVADIKFTRPSKVEKSASIAQVVEVMHEEHIDHVPIFEGGKLYGICTYRDLLRKYLNWSPKRDTSAKFNKIAKSKSARVDNSPFSGLPVHNISTNENLIVVQRTATLTEAVDLMVRNRISDVLVMDGAEFAGILTAKNILKFVSSLRNVDSHKVNFVGLSKLDWHPYEVEALEKISASEGAKLKRIIKKDFGLTLHIKEYEKDGNRKKYAINLRIEYPGQMLSIAQDDWDWRVAVRKIFVNAKNTLEKKAA